MKEVQIVGDGVAGLTAARELARRGRPVRVWGDRQAQEAPAALVHRHAGRSFRTSDVENAVWGDAVKFLDEMVRVGAATRTRMLRPSGDERLARSREHAPDPDAIEHVVHPHFGKVFQYGPAFVVEPRVALRELRDELRDAGARLEERRVDPDDLEGRVVLACGASLPLHLPDVDLRLYGGHLVVFEGELDFAVSGDGFHAVPLGDRIVVGSTWWEPDEPMSDEHAAAKLRAAGLDGGLPLGSFVRAWRGVRCVRHPERRPYIGHVSADRWALGALGTRGWFWAAHFARRLADALYPPS